MKQPQITLSAGLALRQLPVPAINPVVRIPDPAFPHFALRPRMRALFRDGDRPRGAAKPRTVLHADLTFGRSKAPAAGHLGLA
jgi:hypothetical protein